MSSRKYTGPQVKHCTRITLPNSMMQAPPPLHTDLPPLINNIPMSTVMLKTDPLPQPPCAPPPKKGTLWAVSSIFSLASTGDSSTPSPQCITIVPSHKVKVFCSIILEKLYHMNNKVVPMSLWTFMTICGSCQKSF